MEKCIRCERSEQEVRLFDGIYISEPVKICEKCSLIENIPIIKTPSANQLKDSERGYLVRERLSRIAGIQKREEKERDSFIEELNKIEENPELEKPEDMKFKLVDNFHWIIQRSRRRKGFSIKQMAEAIAESETAIKIIETEKVPRDSLQLLRKIEQFLDIKIIRENFIDEALKRTEKKLPPPFYPNENEREMILEKEPEKFMVKRRDEEIETMLEIRDMEKMKEEEGEEMVREAILEEKNPKIVEIEKFEATPLRARDFRGEHSAMITVADLKKRSEVINKDFDFPKKTREETGKEQFESFGKEDTEKIKQRIFADNIERAKKREIGKGKVPTIYDLMKKKEERDKRLVGKDIEIVDDKDKVETY